MDRRAFLQSVAATPLVFGLGDLFVLGQDEKKPEWWDAALKRMRETARPGVVLVAPVEGVDRKTMGQALLERVDGDNADVRELLFEAVFVCVTPEIARRLVPGDGNRVLLDPDGKRAASDTLQVETLDDAAGFVASFRAFLHGDKGERLRAAADRAKGAFAEKERAELEKAIDALDTESDAPDAASILLGAYADRIAPWLVCARLEAIYPQGRDRMRAVIGKAHAKDASRLPHGTTLPKFRSSCGDWYEVTDDDSGPRVACGMAGVSKQGRRFLKMLPK